MVQKLADLNLVNYEKYGVVMLSDKGSQVGIKLLKRHQIIEDLLRFLGISENILEETEKIEHTISTQTLDCLADFVAFFINCPEVIRNLRVIEIKK